MNLAEHAAALATAEAAAKPYNETVKSATVAAHAYIAQRILDGDTLEWSDDEEGGIVYAKLGQDEFDSGDGLSLIAGFIGEYEPFLNVEMVEQRADECGFAGRIGTRGLDEEEFVIPPDMTILVARRIAANTPPPKPGSTLHADNTSMLGDIVFAATPDTDEETDHNG